MGRYERVNLRAMYRATPLGGKAQVAEWEVKVFEPGATSANSAYFTSPSDARAGIREEERRGRTCSGPFPVPIAGNPDAA